MSKTKHSITAAAKITGKGRGTIRELLNAGELSYEVNAKGHKLIEASELLRVFPDECDFDTVTKKGKSASKPSLRPARSPVGEPGLLLDELKAAHAKLLASAEARVEDQIKMREEQHQQHMQSMRLLEDKSKELSGWEEAIREMKEQLSTETRREIDALKDTHTADMRRLKRALQDERDKPWWKKLVG